MMKETPYAPDNQTALPIAYYMEGFRKADPQEIAARTGAAFDGNVFQLTVLGHTLTVDWPDFMADGWKDYDKILFLRFLVEGRITPFGGNFFSYPELPWGEVYEKKFCARALMRFIGMFGTRPELYSAVCEAMGGRKIKGSGEVYELEFMQGLYLRFILWPGDEEFPSSAQILFSDNFHPAFAGEDRVVVCEYVLSRMKRMAAEMT